MIKVLFSILTMLKVMRFAEKIVPHANIIQLKREEETLTNIKQYQVFHFFCYLFNYLIIKGSLPRYGPKI